MSSSTKPERPKLVAFRGGPEPPKPDDDLVDLLRALLADAESGKLRGLIGIAADTEEVYNLDSGWIDRAEAYLRLDDLKILLRQEFYGEE